MKKIATSLIAVAALAVAGSSFAAAPAAKAPVKASVHAKKHVAKGKKVAAAPKDYQLAMTYP